MSEITQTRQKTNDWRRIIAIRTKRGKYVWEEAKWLV